MREELMGILEELRPDVDFEAETQLITNEILDSFDIVALVGEISDNFDVDVHVENLLPENLNSVDAMLQLIEKLQQED